MTKEEDMKRDELEKALRLLLDRFETSDGTLWFPVRGSATAEVDYARKVLGMDASLSAAERNER